MTPRYNVQKAGFTLIEILIATSIFLVVSIVSVASFLASSKSVRKIAVDREVHQAARLVFEQMSRDLRMAKAVACQNNLTISNCARVSATDNRLTTDHLRVCTQDGKTIRDYQYDDSSKRITTRERDQSLGIFTSPVDLTPTGINVLPVPPVSGEKLFKVLPSHPSGSDDSNDPCQPPPVSTPTVKTQPFVEIQAQFFNYDPNNPSTQPEKGAKITLQTMVTLRNFVKQY